MLIIRTFHPQSQHPLVFQLSEGSYVSDIYTKLKENNIVRDPNLAIYKPASGNAPAEWLGRRDDRSLLQLHFVDGQEIYYKRKFFNITVTFPDGASRSLSWNDFHLPRYDLTSKIICDGLKHARCYCLCDMDGKPISTRQPLSSAGINRFTLRRRWYFPSEEEEVDVANAALLENMYQEVSLHENILASSCCQCFLLASSCLVASPPPLLVSSSSSLFLLLLFSSFSSLLLLLKDSYAVPKGYSQ